MVCLAFPPLLPTPSTPQPPPDLQLSTDSSPDFLPLIVPLQAVELSAS